MNKPTADDIKAYMAKHECGMYEARAKLMMEYVKAEVYRIRNANAPPGSRITELCDLLLFTLELNDR